MRQSFFLVGFLLYCPSSLLDWEPLKLMGDFLGRLRVQLHKVRELWGGDLNLEPLCSQLTLPSSSPVLLVILLPPHPHIPTHLCFLARDLPLPVATPSEFRYTLVWWEVRLWVPSPEGTHTLPGGVCSPRRRVQLFPIFTVHSGELSKVIWGAAEPIQHRLPGDGSRDITQVPRS